MLLYRNNTYAPFRPSPLRQVTQAETPSSASTNLRRTNIKKATKQLWRDKFKQQCMDRIKESRMKAFNARRRGFITDESEDEVCTSYRSKGERARDDVENHIDDIYGHEEKAKYS